MSSELLPYSFSTTWHHPKSDETMPNALSGKANTAIAVAISNVVRNLFIILFEIKKACNHPFACLSSGYRQVTSHMTSEQDSPRLQGVNFRCSLSSCVEYWRYSMKENKSQKLNIYVLFKFWRMETRVGLDFCLFKTCGRPALCVGLLPCVPCWCLFVGLLSFGWFVLQIYSFFFIVATDLGQKRSCGGVFCDVGQSASTLWLA